MAGWLAGWVSSVRNKLLEATILSVSVSNKSVCAMDMQFCALYIWLCKSETRMADAHAVRVKVEIKLNQEGESK